MKSIVSRNKRLELPQTAKALNQISPLYKNLGTNNNIYIKRIEKNAFYRTGSYHEISFKWLKKKLLIIQIKGLIADQSPLYGQKLLLESNKTLSQTTTKLYIILI